MIEPQRSHNDFKVDPKAIYLELKTLSFREEFPERLAMMKFVSSWNLSVAVCLAALAALGSAFIATNTRIAGNYHNDIHGSHIIKKTNPFTDPSMKNNIYPISVQGQRKSTANVQAMGVFGLGTLEVIVVLAAAAFLIGPEQLGKWAGELKTDLPDDIKRIPEEFQKGVEEGEVASRARRAKPMETLPEEEDKE